MPADALLLDGEPLQVDQSALTGESLPVTCSSGDTVYTGSVVRQGEIDALVYGTGGNTFFGRTAHLVETVQTVSHFQKAVLNVGDYLIAIAVVLVALILMVAFFRHESVITSLKFALVLTIAAIPVAMPTVLSVTMAVGARVLAAKHAIVSRLAAIEELAGMDVLCSDKTGTLTQNKLTLATPFAMEGVSADEIVLAAALASRAEDEDPIDMAVIEGLEDPEQLTRYKVRHFQPFDPVHKRTEATVEGLDGTIMRVTKGASQVILSMVSTAADIQPHVEKAVQDFASRGYRSLGVARASEDGDWQFLGVLPLYDPPRQDSRTTVETAKAMGIQVKMLTGDQLAIAKETARHLGMGRNILNVGDLRDTGYHETRRLDAETEKANGFAQVFPEDKYHIIDVLQQHDHIVGMTGDGVNDAPALKKADVGIAVSGATDAARAAADIVLLTPGLSVIVDAVKESRKIFQRMNSYTVYRIAETTRILSFMTLAILVFNFYPVTPVMIVLLALMNDGAILSIAFDNALSSQQPERWNMPVVLGVATVLGIAGLFSSFGMFYLSEHVFHLSREFIQTLIYLKLSVAGHLTIFLTRTRGPFWSVPPSRTLFGAVMGTQMIATIIAIYGFFMVPIGWNWALFVWGYSLAWFLLNDRVKLVAERIFDPAEKSMLAE